MSTNNRNGQQQRKSHYSNGDMSSYDGYFTALGYRQMNQAGIIDFAFIDPSFVGKAANQIKKGDKVYDHENRVSLFLSPVNAMVVKQGLKQFREAIEAEEGQQAPDITDQVRSITFTFPGAGGKERVMTFFAPNTTKVKNGKIAVDTELNYVLNVTTTDKEGNEVSACHVMQSMVVDLAFTKKSESEGAQIVIHQDMDLLSAFLDGVILLGTGVLRQGAQMAQPAYNSGGSSTPSRRSQPAASFDDDEGDDEEVGNKKPNKTSRTATALDLESEFEDVPQ